MLLIVAVLITEIVLGIVGVAMRNQVSHHDCHVVRYILALVLGSLVCIPAAFAVFFIRKHRSKTTTTFIYNNFKFNL